MSKLCTALFATPSAATSAINSLVQAGIPDNDISILTSDKINRNAFTLESHSKMAEGAATGAVAVGTVGALVGGLTAVGSIVTGGAGLLVAGPIVAALAGGGAGAAAGAGLGALIGSAIPEHQVKHYEEAITKGSVLVGVQCDDSERKKLIKRVCEGAGATKISSM
jgi:hypothetical protein